MSTLNDYPSHSFVIRVAPGVTPREMTSKTSGERFTIYEQRAFIDSGDAFSNTPFKIGHRNEGDAYDSTKAYQYDPSAFQPGRFDSVELNPFETRLVALEPYQVGTAAKPKAA